MMENMGYDITSSPGLNFCKGRRTLLRSFVPKGRAPDYYHRTRKGLGYVSTPILSAYEFEELIHHNCWSPRWWQMRNYLCWQL